MYKLIEEIKKNLELINNFDWEKDDPKKGVEILIVTEELIQKIDNYDKQ